MADNIRNSQVADRGSSISGSSNENKIEIKKIRKETIAISFIVGFLSSLLASFAYQYWLN